MGSLAGVLLGVSQGMKNEHEREFAIEQEKRQNLLKFYWDYINNEKATPQGRADAMRRLGMLTQIPYNKKLPSEVTKLDTLGQIPLNQGGVPQQSMTMTPPASPSQGTAPPPTPPQGVMPMPGGDGGGPLGSDGGASPGVLQGGASNLPPAPPMGGVPAAAPAPPVDLIPPSSVTVPLSANQPTYTGYQGAYKTAQQEADDRALGISAQTTAQRMGAFNAYKQIKQVLVSQGLPDDQADMQARMSSGMIPPGLMSLYKPTPLNATYSDGTTGKVIQHYDPSKPAGFSYIDLNGEDVTDKIQSTKPVGASVKTGVNLATGRYTRPNGQPIPLFAADGSPNPKLSDNERRELEGAMGVKFPTKKGTKVDAAGNVTSTSSQSVPNLPGSAAPPKPPAGISTKPSSTTSNSRIDGLVKQLSSGQITLNDIKNLKDREAARAQMAASGTTIMPKMGAATAVNVDSQVAALDNSIELVQNIRKNLPVLNSMISAGKIAMAISPDTKELVISRLSDLTPQEEELAANLQSLSEHINTLRQPLGATGFRGPQAFEALQAQRGRLAADPKITDRVLQTTLSSMQKIKQAKGKYLPGAGATPQGGGSDKPADYDFDPVTHTIKPRAPAPPK